MPEDTAHTCTYIWPILALGMIDASIRWRGEQQTQIALDKIYLYAFAE